MAKLKSDREHVTSYIVNNSSFNGMNLFESINYPIVVKFENVRMTIDHEEDFMAINSIVSKLGINKSWLTYAKFVINNPNMFTNQKFVRNQGYINCVKDKNHGQRTKVI